MTLAIIAVSAQGSELAQVLQNKMTECKTDMFVLSQYASKNQIQFKKVSTVTAEIWSRYEGIIFLCASGIAVRSIAPLVTSKYTDPAVVVCPDTAAFAISLLSGHEGGANDLALQVANAVDAMPVITTASEAPPKILPRNIFLGIGCRRGSSTEKLYEAVSKIFSENSISLLRINTICTIDIKKDETGLLDLSKKLSAPLQFFSADELNKVSGSFESSEFVLATTGTDNVCCRAAMAGAANGAELLISKIAACGITIAAAQKKETI
ncbi:MAG: cobalt-precorrin 5A hydrolase [Termitinemataceae bacterium]|nr:MAG: cobalt-precorrin 5A hydrolase [Termitinemataceae bacterium]